MGGQQGEAEGEEKEQVGRAVAYMRIAENKQNQRLNLNWNRKITREKERQREGGGYWFPEI